MKLNHKIDIDLLDFFKTGKFDYLKLGQTKKWILNNFPDPDDYGGIGNNLYDSGIWRYGNIELHFNNVQELSMIFSDYIHTLDGGNKIDLNKWILDKFEVITLEQIIQEFNRLKIDLLIQHKPKVNLIELKVIKSNVTLSFYEEDEIDANKHKLTAFSLK